MSDPSTYTSVFSSHTDGRVAKRNRRPLSCTACRLRKAKCDRQQPCAACTKKGEAASCDYSGSVLKQDSRSHSEAATRLQRLEEMVNAVIKSSNDDPSVITPPLSDTPPPSSSSQRLFDPTSGHLGRNQIDYLDGNHWTSILDSIHDIRAILDPAESSIATHSTSQSLSSPPKSDPLFGPQKSLTIEDVLAALPPRRTMDALLAICFKEKFLTLFFIHSSKFQCDYQAFLANPSSVSFVWISVLFSLLFMAARVVSVKDQDAALRLSRVEQSVILNKAAECLVTGQYLGAQPYSLEALMAYFHCIFALNGDPSVQPWPILTLATRMAQKMGYHRDPKYLTSTFTPFQAEMRRRMWHWIQVFDLMMSAQQGIPSIINEDECDTQSPGNLLDEDFDESTAVLPTPRPGTSHTPVLYAIHKGDIVLKLRPIIRHALSSRRHDFDETIRLHEELEAIHRRIPPVLRLRPVCSSDFTDEDYLIMQRMMLELQYLKGLRILHRAFLTYEKKNPTFEFSRETCRNAALLTLDIQMDYYREVQPGGRLFDIKWMFNHLTLHEFFSAAMIVCLDLSESRPDSDALRSRKLEALKGSLQVWSHKKHVYKDAAHASHVLNAMIAKLSCLEPQQSLSDKSRAPAVTNTAMEVTSPTATGECHDPKEIAPAQDGISQVLTDQSNLMDIGSLEDMLYNPDSVDWNTIDHYLVDYAAGIDFSPTRDGLSLSEPLLEGP